MINIKLKFNSSLWISCFGLASFAFTTVYAAPGILADAPLFTGSTSGNSGAPSNIFIVLDDSGSMAGTMLARKHWDTCMYDPAQQTSCITAPGMGLFLGSSTDWRQNAAGLNVLAYNPNTTYVPWKKGDGTSYPLGTTLPTSFNFDVWHDTHGFSGSAPSISAGGSVSSKKLGTVITTTTNPMINRTVGANGVVDFWDEHTHYALNGTNTAIVQTEVTYNPTFTQATGTYTCSGTTPVVTPAGSLTVTGCGTNNVKVMVNNTQSLGVTNSAAITLPTGQGLNGRTFAQELQNIKNWYQYYRTRINVAKGAVAQVVDSKPNYRYGLSFIDNLTTFVEVPPITATNFIPYNVSLLNQMFAVPPSGYTPLPKALDTAGKYFQDGSTAGYDMLNRTSPIAYECQQNFTILMTDGYWNQPFTSNANIGDSDGDGVPVNVTRTLSDVASYYYKTDLSPTIWDNKVPTSAFDTNNKQHMVTFTVSFGLTGNLVDLDGDGWPDPDPVNQGFDLTESNPNWAPAPNVLYNTITSVPGAVADPPEKIDDLWHAAYNSRGKYISAGSPEEMTNAFTNILNTIASRDYAGSASSISFNGNTLVTTSSSPSNPLSAAYLAQFSKPAGGSWSGDVLAYGFDSVTKAVNTNPTWTASSILDARTTPRAVVTYNGTVGAPFQWANLTPSQKNDFLTDTNGTLTTDMVKAQARLNYIRGDKSNEGTGYNFRVRTHLLGDIIHSDPLYVGKPSGYWPTKFPFPSTSGQTYNSFTVAQASRPGVVYVGANDGMLHAFDALTGSEIMAYIPNTLYSSATAKVGLHYLTDTSYTHRYYVDMPSVTGDVYINTGAGATWHSILLGGEMGGGRGIFALDITDPTLFSEANAAKIALWEFDSTDDPDMGYSYATPSIAMMANNRWAVILGNGYNSSGNGQASLFILFLDGGLDGIWTPGVDYIKIAAPTATDPTTIPIGSKCQDGTLTTCNGLSTPQPYSTKQNSITDRVYAGDLKGNMWAFDLSSSNPSDWGVAYKIGSTPKPLFTATYYKAATAGGIPVQQSTTPQSITSRPIVIKNAQASGAAPNVLVLFGTGQYLVGGDPNTTDVQSIYGIWDHGVTLTGSGTPGTTAYPLTPANLVEQTFLTTPFYDNSGTNVTASSADAPSQMRVLSQNPLTYTESTISSSPTATNARQGWLINLNLISKERLVVDPDVTDDKNLFFNTWIPSAITISTNNLCTTGGSADGYGYKMIVDLFHGTATPAPVIDTNASGVIGCDDRLRAQNANGTLTPLPATSCSSLPVVAGQLFSKGLPASSAFFNNQQFVPGTSDSTIGGSVADPVVAAAIADAQANVDAAKAALAAAKAALDAANADKAAALAALNAANAAAAQAAADAATAQAAAAADPTNATLAAAAQAATDAATAAAAAASAAADALTAATDAAAQAAAAYAQAKVDLNKANIQYGITQNKGKIQNLNAKPPMSRISWQELRND